MDARQATLQATLGAAIRLAVVFSAIASVVALGLDAVGGVSPTALVLTVIVVGFTISWRRTGRVASQWSATHGSHRIATVPIRTHLASH